MIRRTGDGRKSIFTENSRKFFPGRFENFGQNFLLRKVEIVSN